jgi:hypothetical protein
LLAPICKEFPLWLYPPLNPASADKRCVLYAIYESLGRTHP